MKKIGRSLGIVQAIVTGEIGTIKVRSVDEKIDAYGRNHFSKKKAKNKSSKYKGVTWDNHCKKWRCSIWLNRKRKHLGWFKDERLAALTYNKNSQDMFGEYALLNAID